MSGVRRASKGSGAPNLLNLTNEKVNTRFCQPSLAAPLTRSSLG
jgi:hypothetical protein